MYSLVLPVLNIYREKKPSLAVNNYNSDEKLELFLLAREKVHG
jgi:hypothetical protein